MTKANDFDRRFELPDDVKSIPGGGDTSSNLQLLQTLI